MDNEYDRLDEALDKYHVQLSQRVINENIIYHYTSYEGLKGILSSQKLRFTDYKFLNDPTEIEYCKKIILDEMYNHDLGSKNFHLINQFFNQLDAMYKIYISCFSENNKLSLWRYYADNGAGFALGFGKNFFQPSKENDDPLAPTVCEIIYGEKAKEMVAGFFKQFCKVYPTPEEKDRCINRLLVHFIRILPALKHESFQDEEEIRICYTEGELLGKYFNNADRDFIQIKEEDIPFVNVLKGKKPIVTPEVFQKRDIVEILVGPRCNFIEARTSVQCILQDNGYSSEIPIRSASLPFQ